MWAWILLHCPRRGRHGALTGWSGGGLARGIDTRITGSTHISPTWSSDGRSILSGGNAVIHRFRVGENATPERLPFDFPGSAFVTIADMAADGSSALIRLSNELGDVQQSVIRLDGSNTVGRW